MRTGRRLPRSTDAPSRRHGRRPRTPGTLISPRRARIIAASSFRNFKSKGRTRIIKLLVSFETPTFASEGGVRELRNRDTSVAVQKAVSFPGGHVAPKCEKCRFHRGFLRICRSGRGPLGSVKFR